MKHTVIIWEKMKSNGNYFIKTRIVITEKDIEELALIKFHEQCIEDTRYDYTANIDKTEI
jgi:hypothetical protein